MTYTPEELHEPEHAPHLYPTLDESHNAVWSDNLFDDLACYHSDDPIPWLECPEVRKHLDAVLPGYTQRIQAEALREAARIARSIERSGNPATGVISDELLRRAAALAAPVEPPRRQPTDAELARRTAEARRAYLAEEERPDLDPAPPVEQPPTQEKR